MLDKKVLDGFTGTTRYYHHLIGDFNYTDGVHYLAQQGKCYWLLDLIGSYQMSDEKVNKIPFQIWELKVNEDKSAVASMKEDSDKPLLVKQRIPYTDFSLEHIKLWLIDGVLILPSEY